MMAGFLGPEKTRTAVPRFIRNHVVALALLCVLMMIAAVAIFSAGNYAPVRTNTVLRLRYYTRPLNQLRRETVASDHDRALNGTNLTNSLRNRTVVRKIEYGRREKLERGHGVARMAILRAASSENFSSTINDADFVPDRSVYYNPGAFYQSYMEMERRFKVYVYREGDLPISHAGPCKNIYTSEGRFINEMEHHQHGHFRTTDGEAAHAYFMPFSVTWMVRYLFNPNSHDHNPLKRYVADYVHVVSRRYPFWNRTNGADHFMVACHDWGPHASRGNPFVFNNSIRVLCNANTSEGFNPQKDVSLPEIHLLDGEIPAALLLPPADTAARPFLAFFAGGLHGPIRPILLHHWEARHVDFPVYESLPTNLNLSYHSFMRRSKFCLCPSGYEVASPRVVEAIYAECVPVIISDSYVLPFSDVLDWDGFSVSVAVADIPRLREILAAVPEEKYRRLKAGLRVVRKHFTFNEPAKRFDVFHMLLHSIWLRRLNFGRQLVT